MIPGRKVPGDSPVAKGSPPAQVPARASTDADQLDRYLDDLVGPGGSERFPSMVDRRDETSLPRACRHRGQALKGVPTLLGSSYRDGIVVPGNSVTVILTREALSLAFPGGWASYNSEAFDSHLRGAVVYWPWEDYRAPTDLKRSARRIRELHRIHVEMGKTIEVACHGGHGRIGTLLAILAALAGDWPADRAVRLLREAYCAKAVESDEQEEFVRGMVELVRAMS